ncbi:MAG: proline--tRNA ligase [Rhodobacteraceae bacterium]|nr:MAG: proline--tRNA ligase [Paracoccaceae bacterium]
MRLTNYFLPISKEVPTDAQIVSHQLMLRSGMIKQSASGIYSWLPLGLKVLQRVEKVVHEEQQKAGHLPMLMPTIQPAELWRESGRYEDYGKEMLRITDRHEREMLYGPTNEELITDIFRSFIKSYKELPKTLYHIQWKFRDEVRPRFGIMRGREFLMKDGYSFDIDRPMAINAYNRHLVSYLKTYERLGLQAIPMRADTGPIGGDYSHEFLVLAKTGESKVFYDGASQHIKLGNEYVDYEDVGGLQRTVDRFTENYARTEETHDLSLFNQLPEERQVEARGIEVGQIFYFGTKYSEAMDATVTLADGSKKLVEMGSHGIGVSRLVGALIEAHHDEDGIVWPKAVTPFHVAIVNLKQGDTEIDKVCEQIYTGITAAGLDPLYDDREERAGAKFATMDLIGIPLRVTVGPRGIREGMIEVRCRSTRTVKELPINSVVDYCIEEFRGFE